MKKNTKKDSESSISELANIFDLPITQNFTYRLAEASWALNRQATTILNSVCGLGLNEWRVLRMVASNSAKSNTELSKFIGMDKSIISRSMGSLELKGVLALERNRDDRRKVDITLTTKGYEIYKKTLPHMQARQRYLFDQLNEDEQKLLGKVLEKIKHAAANWS
ncbi:MAG: MarR family transcriptional regulator [Gammaproteobacteria bacterium]|nr:MarR family transcriptional regulator [Gammaproteobacteria bacterium]NKB65183.1 MarR family transcriptional regulator [Gammaproteobacteria bacterium]